jgi:hydroxyethylthiazole kinase-like sugar kinase family protein
MTAEYGICVNDKMSRIWHVVPRVIGSMYLPAICGEKPAQGQWVLYAGSPVMGGILCAGCAQGAVAGYLRNGGDAPVKAAAEGSAEGEP